MSVHHEKGFRLSTSVASPEVTAEAATETSPATLHFNHGKRRYHLRRQSLFRFIILFAALLLSLSPVCVPEAVARKRRPPAGGRAAVVVDERLAALREAPDLSARLLQRLGRGRSVAIVGTRRSRDGVSFHRVVVTRRTSGWIQAESLAATGRAGDEERLWRLVRASDEFERLARARLFLDTYQSSSLRPAVLLLFGDAAEALAAKLSREAARRLDPRELAATGAPLHTYFMNYQGLDRLNRLGVRLTFDREAGQFHYDGAAWRELIRRYAGSQEAQQAQLRLKLLDAR